jgi:hypothetical protein
MAAERRGKKIREKAQQFFSLTEDQFNALFADKENKSISTAADTKRELVIGNPLVRFGTARNRLKGGHFYPNPANALQARSSRSHFYLQGAALATVAMAFDKVHFSV